MNGRAAMNQTVSPAEFAGLLRQVRRRQWRGAAVAAPAVALLCAAFAYAGAFDLARYADAAPTILTLCRDSLPPDFGRCSEWGRPLLETLATGVAGTVLGAALALTLHPGAVELIYTCAYPGNVRELENCVRAAAAMARDAEIVERDFACRNRSCFSVRLRQARLAQNTARRPPQAKAI